MIVEEKSRVDAPIKPERVEDGPLQQTEMQETGCKVEALGAVQELKLLPDERESLKRTIDEPHKNEPANKRSSPSQETCIKEDDDEEDLVAEIPTKRQDRKEEVVIPVQTKEEVIIPVQTEDLALIVKNALSMEEIPLHIRDRLLARAEKVNQGPEIKELVQQLKKKPVKEASDVPPLSSPKKREWKGRIHTLFDKPSSGDSQDSIVPVDKPSTGTSPQPLREEEGFFPQWKSLIVSLTPVALFASAMVSLDVRRIIDHVQSEHALEEKLAAFGGSLATVSMTTSGVGACALVICNKNELVSWNGHQWALAATVGGVAVATIGAGPFVAVGSGIIAGKYGYRLLRKMCPASLRFTFC